MVTKKTKKPVKAAKKAAKKAAHAALAVPCLGSDIANTIVDGCTGVGHVNPSTPLGTIFPTDTRRTAFCRCVLDGARAAGMAPDPVVPCSPTTTIAQVVGALTC